MGLFEDAIAAEGQLTPKRVSVLLLSEYTDSLNAAVGLLNTAIAAVTAGTITQPTIDNLVAKMAAVSTAAARLT